jgi:hypothetical protein
VKALNSRPSTKHTKRRMICGGKDQDNAKEDDIAMIMMIVIAIGSVCLVWVVWAQ